MTGIATEPGYVSQSTSPGFLKFGIKDNEIEREQLPAFAITPTFHVAKLEIATTDLGPTARVERILLGSAKDPRIQVKKPIPLDVSYEQGQTIVSWNEIDEFGAGETLSSAIDDFGFSLRDLYLRLFEEGTFGPDLVRIRSILAEYLVPRSR